MADQSYNYGYDSGGGSRRGGNRSNWGFWILALFFLFMLPPVGILMIVIKLAGGGRKKSRPRGRHPYYMQKEQGQMGARTVQMGGQAQSGRSPNPGTVPPANSLLSQMSANAKKMTTVGVILTAVFGFISAAVVSDSLFWLFEGDLAWFLEDTIPMLCCLGGSLGCLWAGLRRQKQVRTFRSYLAMIGSRTTISISALSSAMGVSPAKVRDTLEDMLDDGFFPLGYLDYGSDRLVLTSDGIPDPPKEEEKPAQDPRHQRGHRQPQAESADRPHRRHHRQGVRVPAQPPPEVQPAPQLFELLPAHHPENSPGLRPAGGPGGGRGEHLSWTSSSRGTPWTSPPTWRCWSGCWPRTASPPAAPCAWGAELPPFSTGRSFFGTGPHVDGVRFRFFMPCGLPPEKTPPSGPESGGAPVPSPPPGRRAHRTGAEPPAPG